MKRIIPTLTALMICLTFMPALAEAESASFDYEAFIQENGELGFSWDNDTWKQFAEGLRRCDTLPDAPEYLQFIALHEYDAPEPFDTESYHRLSADEAIEYAQQECERQGIPWQHLQAYAIGLHTVMFQNPLWKVSLYDDHERYTICFSDHSNALIEPLVKADEQTPWYTSFVLTEVMQYNALANEALAAHVLPPAVERQMVKELGDSTFVSLIVSDLYEYGLPPVVEPLAYPEQLDVEARIDSSGAFHFGHSWPAQALTHIDLVNRIHNYVEGLAYGESQTFQLYYPGFCYLCAPEENELNDQSVREYAIDYGIANHLGDIDWYSACCFGGVYNESTSEQYEKVWVVHVKYQYFHGNRNDENIIQIFCLDAVTGEELVDVRGSEDGSVG